MTEGLENMLSVSVLQNSACAVWQKCCVWKYAQEIHF